MMHGCDRLGFALRFNPTGPGLSLGFGLGRLVCTLGVALAIAGCGDDSKPIEEQWPNFTAGATTQVNSGGTTTTTLVAPTTADSTASTPTSAASSTSVSSSPSTSSTSSSTPTSTAPPGLCTPDRFRCLAALPAGWSGPVARKEMNAQGLVPSCDDVYRFQVNETPYHADPQFSAATCSPCSCGTPSGATCSDISNVVFYKTSACEAGEVLTTVADVQADGSCSAVVGTSGLAKSVKVPSPVLDASGSRCQPNGGFASKTAYSWGRKERLCRSRSADNLRCADPNQLCVPKVPATFAQAVCIYRDGDHACPAQTYNNKVLLFREGQDDRGCEACSCGTVSGQMSCKGFFRQFSHDKCSEISGGTSESLRLDTTQASTCGTVNNFIAPAGVPLGVLLELTIEGQSSATCPVSGGVPTGQVQGTDPVTLCCTAD